MTHHLSSAQKRAVKRQAVRDGLAQAGLAGIAVAEPVSVALRSRRRAVFKIGKKSGVVEIGFHARESHRIVDMRECLVLTPGLFALSAKLRAGLISILHDGEKMELHVTEADNGFDLAFRWQRKLTPALTAAIAHTLGADVLRIIFNDEMVMENETPFVTLGGARVALPPQAFLQATHEGESVLQKHVLALTQGAKHLADLFAGLGTFTLPLAHGARVHAVEREGASLAALAEAARKTPGLKPVTTEKRDLFKQPLTVPELNVFDAVVLDPPRAGAQAQTRMLAASKVTRIVCVSCDAASFARDAAMLMQAGWNPGTVTPIDQFLFSAHIELVAGFSRGRGL
jgi:23S rRNA (uracil1939-C5)-methyltransferase